MEVSIWIPSIITTSVLAFVLWLGRNFIKIRLTNSIKYEFDTKLETIRSEFRHQEEILKADLRSKEIDIAALRSGALNAMVSRQISLDKRRMDAIDQLWSSVTALAPAKSVASFMSVLKFDAIAEEAVKNLKLRELFKTMGAGCDPKTIDQSGAAKARPFVSPMVWAIYSAYHAITLQSVIKLQTIMLGLGPKDFTKKEVMDKLVKEVLPHRSDFIDKYGDSAYYYLLDELEELLLREFLKMFAGEEADKASLEKAAEILKLSNELFESAKQSTLPINGETGTPINI